jgi:hypothetical protein
METQGQNKVDALAVLCWGTESSNDFEAIDADHSGIAVIRRDRAWTAIFRLGVNGSKSFLPLEVGIHGEFANLLPHRLADHR